jgi:hypothetical protein
MNEWWGCRGARTAHGLQRCATRERVYIAIDRLQSVMTKDTTIQTSRTMIKCQGERARLGLHHFLASAAFSLRNDSSVSPGRSKHAGSGTNHLRVRSGVEVERGESFAALTQRQPSARGYFCREYCVGNTIAPPKNSSTRIILDDLLLLRLGLLLLVLDQLRGHQQRRLGLVRRSRSLRCPLLAPRVRR